MGKNNSEPLTVIRFPQNAQFVVQTMGHLRYLSPWLHFPRRSDDYILYFIESGDLYIEEDGVRWHIGENSAFLLEPGKAHRGYQAAPISYYYIHFICSEPLAPVTMTSELQEHIIDLRVNLLCSIWDHQWRPSEYDREPLYFLKHSALGGSYGFFQCLREMDRIFFEGLEGRRSLVALRLQEVLTMLCREFSCSCVNPSSTRTLALVRDIRQYLERNYSDPITSQDVSRTFHVNYDYANRQFKKHTGHSIHIHLMRLRINYAQEMLKSGASVSEAGAAVGINDPAYFSRLFKRITRCTPSEYAQQTDRGE